MKNTFRVSIHLTLVSIFFIATSISALLAISLQYYFSQALALEHATQSFQQTATTTRDYLSEIDSNASKLTQILAHNQSLSEQAQFPQENYQLFAEIMNSNALYYSLYVGFENGDFYQLINLHASPEIKIKFNASLRDRWLKVEVDLDKNLKTFTYLDKYFKPRYVHTVKNDFLATERAWYRNATKSTVYRSDPYQFQSLQSPGLTYAIKLPKKGVLGIDIALASLSKQLDALTNITHSKAYIYQPEGTLIASNLKNTQSDALQRVVPLNLTQEQLEHIEAFREVKISNSRDWLPIDFTVSGEPKGYAVEVTELIAKMTGLKFHFTNGMNWPELVQSYKNQELSVLQAVYNTPENRKMGVLSEPWLSLPFAVVTKHGNETINHIAHLKNKKLALVQGWSIIPEIKNAYPSIEIVEFNTPLEAIRAVQSGETDAVLDVQVMLENTVSQYFIEGVMLHPALNFGELVIPETLHFLLQPSHEPLLPIINQAISNITPAQKRFLDEKWLHKQQIKNAVKATTVPHKYFVEGAKDPSLHNRITTVDIAGEKQLIYISPLNHGSLNHAFLAVVIPEQEVYQSSIDKVKTSLIITGIGLLLLSSFSFLFATLIAKPVKRLMQQNTYLKARQFDKLSSPKSVIKEIDELSISLTDMAGAIEAHENAQKQLMESFIELIAQAIDDKSPYTAGHCARVPELGIMLVDKASEAQHGPFKSFSLTTEQQREFRIAAWLHDCGKITTPEHIVDKATKLETIYNRIHEIRMRFEVLWRDAELTYYKKVAKHPESSKLFEQELKAAKARLQDDFAFIADMNVGGEFMSDQHIERVKAISQKTWIRHFDDLLGLSEMELQHRGHPKSQVPAIEPLLSDKTFHIKKRETNCSYKAEFGIKMPIAENEYNRGELHNLTIKRGTLTAEDRFKINEHVISTIKMLDALPFPPELANVPKYASTHHETLIGTGYPRQLCAEDLSIPERILVLADIFEALTAADRPYKPAKSLSTALKIMHNMVKDHHIDQDIFMLFLSSGVYLEYAEKYLSPAQFDDPDIASLLDTFAKVS